MHLQGVIEVLQRYNQLERFVVFVASTDKKPNAGKAAVPFRLMLSEDELDRIMLRQAHEG
jgi:hypothetical protein